MTSWDYTILYLIVAGCVALLYIAYGIGKNEGEIKALYKFRKKLDEHAYNRTNLEAEAYSKGYEDAVRHRRYYPAVSANAASHPD